ncbi:hypothetical protein [Chryseobacterium sp. CT-SW4]|uniref:hypothetical protein n=1 Tax=Chryseobacterium sp. SW-1 TaxID=3157343 RepID=UPI003B013F8D
MENTPDTELVKGGGKMDAGRSDLWHVHKDHLKYGSIKQTRVDFSGRTLDKILEKIADNSDINARYKKTEEQLHTYNECINWIEENCG